MLVSDSETKLAVFRSAVRQFRHNESGAKDMLDTIFNVLERDAEATTGVMKEVAEIFSSDAEKQQSILETLNGWRAERQDQFPALSHPTGLGTNWAGVTSGRILDAKRTTHTSGRSPSSRHLWDRVEAAAASSQPSSRSAATTGPGGRWVPGIGVGSVSAFPSLGEGSSAKGKGSAPAHSTPWSSGGAGSGSKTPPVLTGPIIRSVNFPAPKASASKPLNKTAFPGLPTTGKSSAAERAALFAKPTPRDDSIRRITGKTGGGSGSERTSGATTPTAGWGLAGQMGDLGVEDGDGTEGAAGAGAGAGAGVNGNGNGIGPGAGGKKKGKNKQLLFSVGGL
jgi:hypothetical protein